MPITRSYSDPGFGSKKVIKATDLAGVAINGTNAAATTIGRPFVALNRSTITGFKGLNTTIGTQLIANAFVLNTNSAGTGANVAIGTMSLGTAGAVLAAGQAFTGSVTETAISAGDALTVTLALGTETTANAKIVLEVEYTESFLVSEN